MDIRHTEIPGNVHTGFREDHLVEVLQKLITPPEKDPDWVKPVNLIKAHVNAIAEQIMAKRTELTGKTSDVLEQERRYDELQQAVAMKRAHEAQIAEIAEAVKQGEDRTVEIEQMQKSMDAWAATHGGGTHHDTVDTMTRDELIEMIIDQMYMGNQALLPTVEGWTEDYMRQTLKDFLAHPPPLDVMW